MLRRLRLVKPLFFLLAIVLINFTGQLDLPTRHLQPLRSPNKIVPTLKNYLSADFDGDHIDDFANGSIEDHNYKVNIKLSGDKRESSFSLPIDRNSLVGIFFYDLDNDQDQDILAFSGTGLTLSAWLNDGSGNFTKDNNSFWLNYFDVPGYHESDRPGFSNSITINTWIPLIRPGFVALQAHLDLQGQFFHSPQYLKLQQLEYSSLSRSPPACQQI